MNIDDQARRLQKRARDLFAERMKGRSFREQRSVAEQVGEEVFGDSWDWKISEVIGGGVYFIVLQYQGPA